MNGFIPHAIGATEQTAFVHDKLATSGTYAIGELLYFSSGKLAKCTGTNKPEYIAMQDKVLAADGTLVVTPVRSDIVYETHNSAALSGVTIGQKVTIASDGMRVTATTSSGVAEVLYKDSAADSGTDGVVRVRF